MDVNIVNKLEIVDQTPEFLIENAMNIAETYIENLNFQEPLKMLSQLLTYHKISKFSNDIIICATQLTAAISKKALLNISEPYFTLQVLQNLKLIISVYPSILIPEKLSLFNNLACTFRRIGKLHSAKKYIEKALELLKSHREIKERSSTYLNACAVFSNLNKHKDALEFSAQAVNYAQDAMLNLDEAIDFNEKVGKISVLAISYYNIAVENDYLKRHVEAEEWYMKAIRFLMAHQETQNLKDILQDCVRNYEVLKEKILVYRRPESGKLEVNNSFEKYLPAWKRKEPINRDVNLSFDLSFPLEQKPGSFENMRKDKIDLESKRSSKR